MREKKVLPILHVGKRVMSQCVLLISGRQVNSQAMATSEDRRFNFDERQEFASRIAEKVGIDGASIFCGHDQQIVRPYCPVQDAILNQTWFEVDEWLLRFDLEGGYSSIAAEFCGMNVAFPVQFSA